MATCPNGHENPDGQPFCGTCGQAVTAAAESPSSSTTSKLHRVSASEGLGVIGRPGGCTQ
jgi:hypothetical protein